MCLPWLEKIPPYASPTLIQRKNKPFVTFKSYKNLVSAHFSKYPYLSSKRKRNISRVKIGYMLRETDGVYAVCSIRCALTINNHTKSHAKLHYKIKFLKIYCLALQYLCFKVYKYTSSDWRESGAVKSSF